jgi:hypothetical protein
MPKAKLSPADAYAAIQRLLNEHDAIGRTAHAQERMLDRGFTVDDVRNVLRKGKVSPDVEWDERFENWKYTVRGLDCEGEELSIVIALQPAFARITLITGF